MLLTECSECTVQGSIVPHNSLWTVINMAVYRAALCEPCVLSIHSHPGSSNILDTDTGKEPRL